MKYYIVKEKDRDGYLSRTLCRINDDGSFEEYSCNSGESSGKWEYNKIVHDWFLGKNQNYVVYEPDENEIKYVIAETDDAAYDNYHEHSCEIGDGEHRVYIYQDLKMIDGYIVEDRFDDDIVLTRDDYDYYLDSDSNNLVRKNKRTGEEFIFAFRYYENRGNLKDWLLLNDNTIKIMEKIEKFNYDKLELITNIDFILDFCNKALYKLEKEDNQC